MADSVADYDRENRKLPPRRLGAYFIWISVFPTPSPVNCDRRIWLVVRVADAFFEGTEARSGAGL